MEIRGKLSLLLGDITRQRVDGIVNAANSSLMGGGGVDGAIHRAAGPELLTECARWVARFGPLPAGEAMITGAGNLPARHVIHTVGPVWSGGRRNEAETLAKCYRNCLQLAMRQGLRSLAIPNISTGIYGYPKGEAAEIALKVVRSFLENNPGAPDVILVSYDEESYSIYAGRMHSLV